MLFLGFISGKRIRFPGKWAKSLKNPGSLTSTQGSTEQEGVESLEFCKDAGIHGPWKAQALCIP